MMFTDLVCMSLRTPTSEYLENKVWVAEFGTIAPETIKIPDNYKLVGSGARLESNTGLSQLGTFKLTEPLPKRYLSMIVEEKDQIAILYKVSIGCWLDEYCQFSAYPVNGVWCKVIRGMYELR